MTKGTTVSMLHDKSGPSKTNGMGPGPGHTNDFIHEQGGKRKNNHGQNQIIEYL